MAIGKFKPYFAEVAVAHVEIDGFIAADGHDFSYKCPVRTHRFPNWLGGTIGDSVQHDSTHGASLAPGCVKFANGLGGRC